MIWLLLIPAEAIARIDPASEGMDDGVGGIFLVIIMIAIGLWTSRKKK